MRAPSLSPFELSQLLFLSLPTKAGAQTGWRRFFTPALIPRAGSEREIALCPRSSKRKESREHFVNASVCERMALEFTLLVLTG